jgi:WD40 repeat protein/tRNA A-37 threonylcarbamoyl transferase component Bud32
MEVTSMDQGDENASTNRMNRSPDSDLAPAELADRLCADLVARWRAGDRVPAENYLAHHPSLAGDDEAAFELVYGEFLVRESLGERPPALEFLHRFPQFADQFKRQLDLHSAFGVHGDETLLTEAGNGRRESDSVLDLPGYEILGELGRGGMGVVYRARQRGLNRIVALKVIRAWQYANTDVAERFRAEALAIARFQHPNLIQVFEVGECDGQGFLALEFASGGSLQQQLAGAALEPLRAAALVECLARGLHYAHQRGIVHRDLKPANVVLTEDGVPKVTDFGLAKLIEDDSGLTRTGDIIGTPSYMAPEQARGASTEISPVTDVYSLGAILYETLTGRPPFRGSMPLSTLEQVTSQDPLPPGKLQRHTPRDLETICLKCLEKEPRRRYRNAAELADDLRRFLDGQPISARRIGWAGRALKWCRREPAKAGLAGALAATIAGGFIGMAVLWRRAEAKAVAEAHERNRAVAAESATRDHLYLSQIAQAQLEWRLGNVAHAQSILDQSDGSRRGWEWRYLWNLNHPELLTVSATGMPYVNRVAFSPDGSRIAFSAYQPFGDPSKVSGVIEVRDAHDGSLFRSFTVPGIPTYPAFSRDGRRLAVASSSARAWLWDLDTAKPLREWTTATGSGVISFSPDGRKIISGTGGVQIWDAESGRLLHRFASAESHAKFSPDGRTLWLSTTQAIEIRDAESGREIGRLSLGAQAGFFFQVGPQFEFSPDGRLVVVATNPPRVWTVEARQPLYDLGGHDGAVTGVAFRPDGRQVATCSADATIRLWDVLTGTQQTVLRGHSGTVSCVAFHPDGWCLLSGGRKEGEVKLWDLTRDADHRSIPAGSAIAIAFDPGSRRVSTTTIGGLLREWETDGSEIRISTRLDLTGEWLSPSVLADYSDDNQRVATIAADGRTIKAYDATNGQELTVLAGLTAQATHVDCGTNGRRIAAVSRSRSAGGMTRDVKVWDAVSGAILAEFHPAWGPGRYLRGAVALNPDGSSVAFDDYSASSPAGSARARIRVCAVGNGRELLSLPLGEEGIIALAFSPDGDRLAAADLVGAVAIWNTVSGVPLPRRQSGASDPIFHLAFSPDSQRLAGVDREKIRIWETAGGREVIMLRGAPPKHDDPGFNPTVAWTADGARLACTNWDGSISVWEGTQTMLAPSDRLLGVLARRFTWHLGEAEIAAKAGDFRAVAFHLERLQCLDSTDSGARARRDRLIRDVEAKDRATLSR